MKTYKVTQNKMGKRYVDTIVAENVADARKKATARRKGVVVDVTESKGGINLNMSFDGIIAPKLRMPTYIAALRQLAVMTDAGISIHDSVGEVALNSKDRRVQQIFGRIRDDLNAGMSLSDSIKQFQKDVGNISIALITLGEQTGRLAESLAQLVNILQDVLDNKQKFKKAMRYPITVIVAIVVAFTILMIMVVPKFREIFESFDAELPLPTRILLNIEYVMTNYGLLVLAILIGTIVANIYLYRKNSVYKYGFDKYILKVYLIGNIIFYSTMHRFNLIFGELVRAGIPVVDSLETAILNVDNDHLKERLEFVKTSVTRGNSLSSSIMATELYENMLVQMISAGERSGRVDDMVDKVTAYYKGKFNDIIDNISAYVEPILLVFIAGMVILMALGIFMPMWDLAKAAKGV